MSQIFAGTKAEYIALHEKVLAWPAILLVFARMKKLPDDINLQELRKQVEQETGYPFSELAIRLALTEPTFELATPVSSHSKEKYFHVRKSDVSHYIDIHTAREDNRLSRLMSLPHDSFRAEVDKVRRDAAAKFDQGKRIGHVYPPIGSFSDYSFEYLKSALVHPKTRSAFRRPKAERDWQKIGVAVAVILGLLAILATLYAGNKL